MKINKKWEFIYLILWIISIVLLMTFFVLAIVYQFVRDNSTELITIFWGLMGVSASFLSAFFVAWVVEQQSNKDEIARKERIRNFYLRKPLQRARDLFLFVAGVREDFDEYLKPYFVDGEINFENFI